MGKSKWFPLLAVPITACVLTMWMAHGIFDNSMLPVIGLLALAYAFSRGLSDRRWMLATCASEQDFRSQCWYLARCYGVGLLWFIGGLYAAYALRMNPPWLACLAL